jgi:hypothetical protein
MQPTAQGRQRASLREFLQKIEKQYGRAECIWIMDRGIPTEEVLAEMRAADPPVLYLVGTPKGRLAKLEQALLALPWHVVRQGVEVKPLPQGQEVYVLAQSRTRIHKERAMRRRQLKRLWARLKRLSGMRAEARSLADEAWRCARQCSGSVATDRHQAGAERCPF